MRLRDYIMKVSFSFDDGRSDQYEAYKILKKYNFKGSFHVTTGFIDGTYKTDNFGIKRKPLAINQLIEMNRDGMDISSHGDKHVMDTSDFIVSYNKLRKWGLESNKIGFSVPNSAYDDKSLKSFYGNNKDLLSYIRVGRSRDCFSFKSKICYVLYHFFHLQIFFNAFNKYNLINELNKESIVSLVVKKDSKVKNIKSFITHNKAKETVLVLMFHSIVKRPSNKWEYSLEEFEDLCLFLKNNTIDVLTLQELVL